MSNLNNPEPTSQLQQAWAGFHLAKLSPDASQSQGAWIREFLDSLTPDKALQTRCYYTAANCLLFGLGVEQNTQKSLTVFRACAKNPHHVPTGVNVYNQRGKLRPLHGFLFTNPALASLRSLYSELLLRFGPDPWVYWSPHSCPVFQCDS